MAETGWCADFFGRMRTSCRCLRRAVSSLETVSAQSRYPCEPVSMIHGVLVHPLRQIPDERGKVMHMLRCDDPHFERFGEIYFSVVYPGVIKGWHLHREMTLNYAVVAGTIK